MADGVARVAVVSGDVTMDWLLALSGVPPQEAAPWNPQLASKTSWQPGGALLLAELVRYVAAHRHVGPSGGRLWDVRSPRLTGSPSPCDPDYQHAFSLWVPCPPRGERHTTADVWRVHQFLGNSPWSDDPANRHEWNKVDGDDPGADLVVLIDAGMGYRTHRHLWPVAIGGKRGSDPPWIILRLTYAGPDGDLWKELHDRWADRLIVVTSLDDLRHSQAQISRQLSWERTAQDTVWELEHNQRINGLSDCAHVVISAGAAGAIVVSRKGDESAAATLLFDSKAMEREWGRDLKGRVIGSNSCLTAALARQVLLVDAEHVGHAAIKRAVQSGVAAMRTLEESGYGRVGDVSRDVLKFPLETIGRKLGANEHPLSTVTIQRKIPRLSSVFWTALAQQDSGGLDKLARDIVVNGVDDALREIPVLRLGGLAAVDRLEIEALRSVQRLISEYKKRDDEHRPLCIAVFGPPGAGKSFGVHEVARHTLGGQFAEPLEFNLSQFRDPADLLAALHRVRDERLSGKLPVVFWDEFDTSLGDKKLGWLRYFLSPMQDGKFQQGEITHPIGRCIFVFAGSTAKRMREFGNALQEKERQLAKVPDFISRIHGYMDVLGPNPQERGDDEEANAQPDAAGSTDPYFIIRRATLLRTLLESNAKQIVHDGKIDLDPSLLRAFLKTTQYTHGVRSMLSVIKMSLLAGQEAFEISSLPPRDQLALHVSDDFLDLVEEIDIDPATRENLARLSHNNLVRELKRQGWHRGPATDRSKKIFGDLKEYDRLADNRKQLAQEFVEEIANLLPIIGYAIGRQHTSQPAISLSQSDVQMLAQAEYEKFQSKIGECDVSWQDLSKAERAIDETLVTNIPRVLGAYGFAIKKTASRVVAPSATRRERTPTVATPRLSSAPASSAARGTRADSDLVGATALDSRRKPAH